MRLLLGCLGSWISQYWSLHSQYTGPPYGPGITRSFHLHVIAIGRAIIGRSLRFWPWHSLTKRNQAVGRRLARTSSHTNDMAAKEENFRLCRDIQSYVLGHLTMCRVLGAAFALCKSSCMAALCREPTGVECRLYGAASDKSPETSIEGQVLGDSLTRNRDPQRSSEITCAHAVTWPTASNFYSRAMARSTHACWYANVLTHSTATYPI